MRLVEFYTDGSCSTKDRIGGWAVLKIENVIDTDLTAIQSVYSQMKSDKEEDTTSSRMELTGLLEALRWIQQESDIEAVIYSDSTYAVHGYNEWLENWMRQGTKSAHIKNKDLWTAINDLKQVVFDRVTVKWVKAHAGNQYNEAVDKLANKARES